MKKLRLIFYGLLLSVALVGCGKGDSVNKDVTYKYNYYGGRKFLVINYEDGFTDTSAYKIYVDTETRVQYIAFDVHNYSSPSHALIDADGKPILYDGEI